LASAFQLSLCLCFFARHSLTRHQFYLQLRKDILEERLHCNDETLLQLGALALQAEFGNYPKEVGADSWGLWVESLEKLLWGVGTASNVETLPWRSVVGIYH
jgi:hypothetical protein